MGSIRKNNNNWNTRVHLNSKAFAAVIDTYLTMRTRRSVGAMNYGDGVGGTSNDAKPTSSDFCCDVENAIKAAVKSEEMYKKFLIHYVYGYDILELKQQGFVEQLVGQKLRRRDIWPLVGKNGYFTSIRKPRN